MANDDKSEVYEEQIDEDDVNVFQVRRDFVGSIIISFLGLLLPYPFFGLQVYAFFPLCLAIVFFIAYKADRILHKQMRTNEKITAQLEAERKEHQIQYDELCKKLDELEKQLQSKE